MRVNDEVHELNSQSSALIQDSLADDFDVGESGEEKQHCQAIVEIGQRVLFGGTSWWMIKWVFEDEVGV